MNIGEHWQHTIDHYARVKDKDGIKQMLKLVSELHNHTEAIMLYPSISIYSLGLSKYEKYKDRIHHPMVYIDWGPDDDTFVVHWFKKLGKAVKNTVVHAPLCDNALAEIIEWLNCSGPAACVHTGQQARMALNQK
jgi:hypothetical protein